MTTLFSEKLVLSKYDITVHVVSSSIPAMQSVF